MNRLKLLLIVWLVPFLGAAQNKLTLEECRDLARENFPKLQQAELLGKITKLKNENTQTNYLPQIDLKGQATYQSEVIEIKFPEGFPNFTYDPVSKDQYKVYLDVKQTIWDGGLTKSKQALQDAQLEADVQKLQIEVQQAIQMVDAYYFGVLMVDQNTAVLASKQEVLSSQIDKMGSAIKYGAGREKEKLKLEMENLQLGQKLTELASKRKTFIELLSVLTGKPLGADAELAFPESVRMQAGQMRPEMKYFDLQMQQLDFGDNLLNASRNPLFFGFGQAGYGKPGFNMLKNEFSPYYIVGVGLNWRVLDWKKVKRNKEINQQHKAMINTLQSDFLQKQDLQKAEASEKISNLRELIKTDEQLVEGRTKIAESSAAELENGTITSTDYLIDLNAATVAEINLEMHKIQLIQSIVNYNTILGY